MAQLIVLESQDLDRDIIFYVNSPGGSFMALTAIYDTMQYIKLDVQTYCHGQAASAADVLACCGQPQQAVAPPNACVMIHQPAMYGGDSARLTERYCVVAKSLATPPVIEVVRA